MGALQRELKQLTDKGIINRKEQGNLVYFQANKGCPIFGELKGIVVKMFGLENYDERERLAK
ncbi:MAG TPA: transcriptional regulator, partial [Caldisericia bacterium]|nr:transcriptional regulator [Caldisericia bacterium]